MTATLPMLGRARAPGPDFERSLQERGLGPLVRGRVTTLQINVGKLCNQACHHCHVEAGPKRTEVMPPRVAERAIEVLAASPGIDLVDITGGAPELCPSFRTLVTEAGRLGRRVIDRCNLTILFEPGHEDLAEFLARHEVQVVASLPCYLEENVDKQRGRGVFRTSIRALQLLNSLGYGRAGSPLRLDLVYNPVGAYLPPPQAELEADYKEELRARFGIDFDRLLTITNMPVKRFADWLDRTGEHEAYMGLLVNHFNPAAVPGLMCRSLVSVDWEGRLYDCDFNQMLEMPVLSGVEGPVLSGVEGPVLSGVEGPLGRGPATGGGFEAPETVFDIRSFEGLEGRPVATGSHCFGCTAGAGSSCGGALS